MAVYITPVMSLRRTVASGFGLFFWCAPASLPEAYCQEPIVDRLDVANLRPGQKATVVVNGKQLSGRVVFGRQSVRFDPKKDTDLTKDQPVPLKARVKADAVPGIYPARMVTNHGCSEAGWWLLTTCHLSL